MRSDHAPRPGMPPPSPEPQSSLASRRPAGRIRLRTPRLGSDASGHRSPTEDRQGYRRALAGPSAVGVCWAPIASGLGSVFVVIPTGSYANLVVSGLVDEAVHVCDASRPIALKPMSEWLRLTDPVVAVASDVLDQGVDPFERLAVLTLPPQIVLPGAFIPDDLHSARSRSTPSPSSSRLIESSRRRAFAGLLSRYAVSFSDS